MFILGNFFYAVGVVLRVAINFETAVIIIAAILSWIPQAYSFRVYHILRDLADIVERPLRRVIPTIGYIDITPLVAILVLIFLDRFLAQSLIDLGWRLR
ncbi:YggT family protein [Fervidobacterium changbaicum]|uniref:YggT family protein n=2 Tax=Fervidobacterium TaxID=2422 RepID=A0AAI8CKT1_FERIS|nr:MULTISPECIES: YggT family protein [Fervidobacterium]AMW32239.1 YggT family protein [Fervidobacterium islandicum]QAV32421.1 YggT family protein [Fervidobacterium changbaicum]SDH18941.1 YggT family protein [Fervidobacterium changbaicum]